MEELKKELDTGDKTKDLILEGWPAAYKETGDISMLINQLGTPDYIL